jgi:hypothetical protein
MGRTRKKREREFEELRLKLKTLTQTASEHSLEGDAKVSADNKISVSQETADTEEKKLTERTSSASSRNVVPSLSIDFTRNRRERHHGPRYQPETSVDEETSTVQRLPKEMARIHNAL